jgi:purine-binding chemotaxis protein CheW
MAGVINLRGHVVPVINLRDEFRLPEKAPDVDTCIIIFEFEDQQGSSHMLGCIVDSVSEVLEISSEQTSNPPKIGNHIDPSFIETIAKIDEHFVILLNMTHILSQDQLNFLSNNGDEEISVSK